MSSVSCARNKHDDEKVTLVWSFYRLRYRPQRASGGRSNGPLSSARLLDLSGREIQVWYRPQGKLELQAPSGIHRLELTAVGGERVIQRLVIE